MAIFKIASMGSGHLYQLQTAVFGGISRVFYGSGTTRAVALYLLLSISFGMLVVFTNSSLKEFHIGIWTDFVFSQ